VSSYHCEAHFRQPSRAGVFDQPCT
jgi:hypothetical protein